MNNTSLRIKRCQEPKNNTILRFFLSITLILFLFAGNWAFGGYVGYFDDFESAEGYQLGSLHTQNNWYGGGYIVSSADKSSGLWSIQNDRSIATSRKTIPVFDLALETGIYELSLDTKINMSGRGGHHDLVFPEFSFPFHTFAVQHGLIDGTTTTFISFHSSVWDRETGINITPAGVSAVAENVVIENWHRVKVQIDLDKRELYFFVNDVRVGDYENNIYWFTFAQSRFDNFSFSRYTIRTDWTLEEAFWDNFYFGRPEIIQPPPPPPLFPSWLDWYLEHSEYEIPTATFSAIAGFFEPTYIAIGEFGHMVKTFLNIDEAHSYGASMGMVLPTSTHYIEQIEFFFGGFPIIDIFIVSIVLLLGIFIFRLILKFIPGLG